MKQSRWFIALVFVVALAASAVAQDVTLKVSVPFEFAAGGKMLPAGDYTVLRAPTSAPEMVVLRSDAAHSSIILNSANFDTHVRGAKLVFNRYGEKYFLSQIWTTSGARSLAPSKAERIIAQQRDGEIVERSGSE